MPTYTASYFTDADWAERTFEAATADDALAVARAFYDDSLVLLDFRSYDHIEPLTAIAIEDETRVEVLRWCSEDQLLRLAASDLLTMLKRALQALNTAPRFKVPHLGTDSYSIAAECEAVIAKATRNL